MILSQATYSSRVVMAAALGPNCRRALLSTARALPRQYQVHEQWTRTLADEQYTKKEGLIATHVDDARFQVSWEHHGATPEQLKEVGPAHLEPKTTSDKLALGTLRFVRKTFDLFTGYHHPPPGQENNPKYAMTEAKWLERFIFLESIAGVPGMVGGMVRHLQSLRLMRRDKGWIETLLEEAYNERMHLLTFMKLGEPGMFMRLMLLGGQGVFFNLFFLSYLVMPRVCHRFVGYLEEEAVVTYTRCIEDIESGRLPGWRTRPAPAMAIEYWKMPADATLLDLIYYVRADESKHREVNHTFGNLEQKHDRNPYALRVIDDEKQRPQPVADMSFQKPTGWTREEIAA